jgi:osmotically-inducible protein OsmY
MTSFMKYSKRRIAPALVLVASAYLSACVPLPFLVGGAVMGGSVVVATDRRTAGTQLEDQGIELKSSNRISESLGERVHVNVMAYNRQVLLTGEAPNAGDKQAVEKIVAGVENVRNIVNEIEVLGISTMGQRSSDAVVTGRVKATLIDDKELNSNAFKITTEHGVTYLMGRVTQREATLATDRIAAVSGVQRLVRVLEYISEEELVRISPPPANK